MALFDGVENFTPAFTGQQIAIQAGQGAGQSISRGQQVKNQGKSLAMRSDNLPSKFGGNQSMYLKQIDQLDAWGNDVSDYFNNH